MAASAATFIGLLAVLDQIAHPFDPQTGKLVPDGPFGEVSRILTYAANQTSPHGPQGIASYPWDWLVDVKPITYLQIDPSHPTAALNQIQPAVHFLGMISPPILLLLLPAMVVAALGVSGRRVAFARTRSGSSALGLVRRDVRAVRAPQPDREPDELPLLHGDRDAGDLRGGGRPGQAGSARAGRC